MIVLTTGPNFLCAMMGERATWRESVRPDGGERASGVDDREREETKIVSGGGVGTSSRARTEDPLIKSQML